MYLSAPALGRIPDAVDNAKPVSPFTILHISYFKIKNRDTQPIRAIEASAIKMRRRVSGLQLSKNHSLPLNVQ